jgi:prepilin-type N-terminal cleavage/methylation domain-containing protein
MSTKLSKRNQGFTIIEVLIVLAIAGLIMVMVFIAVPNLQRNQRNTGRRQDASRVLTAVDNFVTNANGTMPSINTTNENSILTDGGPYTQYSLTAGAGTETNLTVNKLIILNGTQTLTATNGQAIAVVTNAQCNNSVLGSTTSFGRKVAVVYTLEPASGSAWQLACISN